MKMQIDKQVKSLIITVTPAKSPIKDIVGFAELQLIDEWENTLFIVRGYTIRVKVFNNTPMFIVSAPAFRSGLNFKQSFIVEDKSFWHIISGKIVDEFRELTGDKKPEDYISNEDIDPKSIPF